jgi:hypothetical protein
MSDNTATYAAVKVCELPIFLPSSLILLAQHLHKVVPAFSPYVPVGFLSYLAFLLLTATFGLAFYFTTYVKFPLPPRAIYSTCLQPTKIDNPNTRNSGSYRS